MLERGAIRSLPAKLMLVGRDYDAIAPSDLVDAMKAENRKAQESPSVPPEKKAS